MGLNVHLGRGPLGRVAGKKASNTDPTYIKKTKTRLYNAKNPCGIENGMENWFVGIWRSPTRILGGTNLESTLVHTLHTLFVHITAPAVRSAVPGPPSRWSGPPWSLVEGAGIDGQGLPRAGHPLRGPGAGRARLLGVCQHGV